MIFRIHFFEESKSFMNEPVHERAPREIFNRLMTSK